MNSRDDYIATDVDADIRIVDENGNELYAATHAVSKKENSIRFDEVSCSASYCLPVKSVTLEAEPLPATLAVKGFDGKTESVIQVTDVSYHFDGSISPRLNITLAGVKTHSNENTLYKSVYDIISYKLYNSGGYLVDSGNVYLSSLAVGDKFKDDSIVIYDVTPGEAYTLKLMEYEW